ncbi:hypothetical protein EVB55_054 [Rhizobium phage RHph_Y68]|uniref:Uncharacterized protein n=1 Tax=Rhizobium phage RHph_Y68 TaxID=2509787 RepID=A0A7S5USV7_9CAUD|nr:hypothetical protein PP934_gp054 [Rhizobium phage RHph_Y68]QIG67989.1 hypothetical protein EVB55_054 [Rhizobium phage RHph_Y68]
MFILETVLDRRLERRVFKIQEPTVFEHSAYSKFARQVNVFFHRMAKDRIRYNRTNIRIFSRYHDDEWDGYLSVNSKVGLKFEIHPTVNTMDQFFEEVGFHYRKKKWSDPKEFAMKWDAKLNRFVKP